MQECANIYVGLIPFAGSIVVLMLWLPLCVASDCTPGVECEEAMPSHSAFSAVGLVLTNLLALQMSCGRDVARKRAEAVGLAQDHCVYHGCSGAQALQDEAHDALSLVFIFCSEALAIHLSTDHMLRPSIEYVFGFAIARLDMLY